MRPLAIHILVSWPKDRIQGHKTRPKVGCGLCKCQATLVLWSRNKRLAENQNDLDFQNKSFLMWM